MTQKQTAIIISYDYPDRLNQHLELGYTVASATPFSVATGSNSILYGLILVILNEPLE